MSFPYNYGQPLLSDLHEVLSRATDPGILQVMMVEAA